MRLYVPLDVQYLDNEKFEDVSPEAELLYIRSLCLVKRRMTDGWLSGKHLRRLCDRLEADRDDLAAELVDAGLWERCEDGFRIVSWLDHNEPAEAIRARRKAESERKAEWRRRKSQGTPESATPDATERDASRDEPSGGTRRRATPIKGKGREKTETAAAACTRDDVIDQLVARRRELTTEPIRNPERWTEAVRRGIEAEHGAAVDEFRSLGWEPADIVDKLLPLPPPPKPDYIPPPDPDRSQAAALRLIGEAS